MQKIKEVTLYLLLLVLAVALGAVVKYRLSSDAAAVIIGVVVGIAASVPTSLLLVALSHRSASAKRQPSDQ